MTEVIGRHKLIANTLIPQERLSEIFKAFNKTLSELCNILEGTTGIAGKLFVALGQNGVNIIAITQGSSELNITVVVKKEDEVKAIRVVHEAFFLSP